MFLKEEVSGFDASLWMLGCGRPLKGIEGGGVGGEGVEKGVSRCYLGRRLVLKSCHLEKL